MPELQSFHILLAHKCWNDYFFKQSDHCEIEHVVPYLQWVKDMRCRGEVVVRLYDKDSANRAGTLGRLTEMRLKDGEFVECGEKPFSI